MVEISDNRIYLPTRWFFIFHDGIYSNANGKNVINFFERNFLFHDASNLVIEALCRNPQLTMPEVIKLLRIPTLLPTTLELLSRESRWSSTEEIMIMIATHPRVTFPVADRLVKTLSLLGIRKVIRRPGLNPAIKDQLVQSIPHKQLQGW